MYIIVQRQDGGIFRLRPVDCLEKSTAFGVIEMEQEQNEAGQSSGSYVVCPFCNEIAVDEFSVIKVGDEVTCPGCSMRYEVVRVFNSESEAMKTQKTSNAQYVVCPTCSYVIEDEFCDVKRGEWTTCPKCSSAFSVQQVFDSEDEAIRASEQSGMNYIVCSECRKVVEDKFGRAKSGSVTLCPACGRKFLVDKVFSSKVHAMEEALRLENADARRQEPSQRIISSSGSRQAVSSHRSRPAVSSHPDTTSCAPNMKKCPDCGRIISKTARACPGCGHHWEEWEVTGMGSPLFKLIISAISFFIIFVALGGC